MEIKTDVTPEKKYKNFDKTFPFCTGLLALAFLYPNRSNALKRAIYISIIITVNGGQLFWFFAYTLKCLQNLDIINLTRNMTLKIILLLFFFKTYYVMYVTQKYADLLDKISEDLLEANDLDEDCQQLFDEHLKICKFAETVWVVFPILLSAQFPIYSGILMSIESIQTDDFQRRMVHDMDLLFVEDIQWDGPFYHCMFTYNCIQCVVLLPNYSGFDGSFCIATTHLCLKLKLIALKVEKAFKTATSQVELTMRLREAIKDHQKALAFYNEIQDLYGPWLFGVFLLTSFLISFNLYQLYLLQRLDLKYVLFGLFGVFHIYIPCQYASTLTEIGEALPDYLYLVPWEKWAHGPTTTLLIFMICRAQKPLILTGQGIVTYNMETFKSILQTSYSFFTLITA